MSKTRWRSRRGALLAALTGLISQACLPAACNEDADLEAASREVGVVPLGGRELVWTANLQGRYVRERGGGGRLTYSCATDEESWTLRVAASVRGAESHEPVVLGRYYEHGNTREALAWGVTALRVESCASQEATVFRLRGHPAFEAWRVAYTDPVHVVAGPALDGAGEEIVDAGAECAALLSRVASASRYMEAVHLAAIRGSEPAEGAQGVTSRQAVSWGEKMCHVLLARDDPEAGLRCYLDLGTHPGGGLRRALVRRARASAEADGAERGVDYRGALAALMAAGPELPAMAEEAGRVPPAEAEALISQLRQNWDRVQAVYEDYIVRGGRRVPTPAGLDPAQSDAGSEPDAARELGIGEAESE